MTWELQFGNTRQTLAEWGIEGLHRTLVNQAPDVVTFSTPGVACDSAPLFEANDTIRILRDGVPWFYGRVVSTPGHAAGQDEGRGYRVVGPWWYLDNLVFEQVWYQATNPLSVASSIVGGYKSKVLLNQGFNGSALSTGGQIAEAVAWAITNGAPIQATTALSSTTSNGRVVYHPTAAGWPDLEVPITEAQDITVAEVIRKCLRWTPDVVTWFDYTTTPPTLHMGRRASLTAVSLSLGSLESLAVTPRHDLVVPAVALRFEQQQQLDSVSWVKVTRQIAPPAAQGPTGDILANYRFGALVATIDLMGSVTTYEYANIETQYIDAGSAIMYSTPWWKARVPWLADPKIKDLVIDLPTLTRSGSLNLPRELITGTIVPWMNVQSEDDTISVKVSYRVLTDAQAAITNSNQSGTFVRDKEISVRLTTTNALTQIYRTTSASDPGEMIPQGLATALYAAMGVLQYEGEAVLTQSECAGQVGLGNVLNITSGQAEWATMSALVQSVDEDVDVGRTAISFGPAQHLGPQDLVELLRVNRLRLIRTRLDTRDSGRGGSNQRMTHGDRYPQRAPEAGVSKITQMEMYAEHDPRYRVGLSYGGLSFNFQDPADPTQNASMRVTGSYVQLESPGGGFTLSLTGIDFGNPPNVIGVHPGRVTGGANSGTFSLAVYDGVPARLILYESTHNYSIDLNLADLVDNEGVRRGVKFRRVGFKNGNDDIYRFVLCSDPIP